jgi:hypothetical protein
VATAIVIAKFDGTQDSVVVDYTSAGLKSFNPIVIPGAAVVSGDATPGISIAGTPTRTSCVVQTTGRFTGYVAVEVMDQRPGNSSAIGPAPPSAIYFPFDSNLQGNGTVVNPVLTALNGLATPVFQQDGRKGQALYIPGSTGYYWRGDPGYPAPGSGNGWAWMGWVFIEALGGTQGVIWQEGLDLGAVQINGIKIYVDAAGKVNASIGAAGAWALNMQSARTIGVRAWHHVALAYDGANAYIYVDGQLDQTSAYGSAPQSSATSPIALGAQYGAGAGTNILNGAIDEVKFITFPVSGGLGFILKEPWLAFKAQVVADLKAAGKITNNVAGENSLNSPTRAATNILRAWINSFITNARAGLPVQPYAYSVSSAYPIDGVLLSAIIGVNSTYQNLKNGVTTGLCGVIGETLWGVFQAFGFPSRIYDMVNAPDWRYSNSHVTVEVWMTDNGSFCLQDATYNIMGVQTGAGTNPGKYNTVEDVKYYTGSATLPWGDDGVNYNADRRFTLSNLASYQSYFVNFVNIVPSYHLQPGE